ncbi:hypothetical protein ACFYT4_19235 [Streptomyces sp. NPDC004609]|uniref:hypothetical protein n=1 Tax=Streptomyces sp. NPDC004609 TaxID=3364704 RepID=UPI00369DF5F2
MKRSGTGRGREWGTDPGTGWGNPPGERWITRLLVPSVALAVLAAVTVIVRNQVLHDAQLAANRAQLKRACQGLLPQDRLRPFLPDRSAGRLVEYGTVLEPGQESRALLDCRLSWDGRGTADPDGAEVRVRAEPLLRMREDTPEDSAQEGRAFPLPLPPSAVGDSETDEDETVATLLVTCPGGLVRRTGRTAELQVMVSLPLPSRGPGRDRAEVRGYRLAAARTAASVANWIAERRRCGGEPLALSGRAPTAPDPALCDWLDPAALGLGGSWQAGRDRPYRTRNGTCETRRTDLETTPERLTITSISVRSAAGAKGRQLHEQHRWYTNPPPRKDGGTVWLGGDPLDIAVWAEAVCGGERAYHRISVVPEIPPDRNGQFFLTGAERRRLADGARAVLTRYLAAGSAWPRRSHCRDTTVVEGP